MNVFFDFIGQILNFVLNSNLRILLLGDFSNGLCSCDFTVNYFLDTVHSTGCDNFVQLPTRVTPDSETLIYLFITNYHKYNVMADVLACGLRDHFPNFFPYVLIP